MAKKQDPQKTYTSENNNTHRIVMTGGPGGGKTTAAELIRRELGEEIVIVPEAATMLFRGGFPRYEDDVSVRAIQKAIYHVQTNIENVQCCKFPGRVLLCDRGTVDSLVYWPNSEADFYRELETSLEHEFNRYDAVIFFETAAVGDLSIIEGGNPVRTESNQQAIELDQRLHKIWAQHPNFTHIPHERSFFKKLEKAFVAVENVLASLGKTIDRVE